MEQEHQRNLGNDIQSARRIFSLAKNVSSLAIPSSLPIAVVAVVIAITFFLILSTSTESKPEIAATSPTPQPSGARSISSPTPTDASTSTPPPGSTQTPTPDQPPSLVKDCPIPNGVITCGSRDNIVNGCGHCNPRYYPESSFNQFCNIKGYDAIKYAIDIGSPDGSPVYLPKINGHVVEWTWEEEIMGKSGEPFQNYTGVDKQTGENYFLSLHHTQPGSGNKGTHNSGERGANVCLGCNENHVHVELGKAVISGKEWLDAVNYFCEQ